jgi:hypothetical protein
MTRLGQNLDSYRGEQIEVESVLREALALAATGDWTVEQRPFAPGRSLSFLKRPGTASETSRTRRIYLSAGIHGDEPAGPLAVRRLLAGDLLPRNASLWVCPCLNPTGFPRNTRQNAAGIDLNRDYLHLATPEIGTHTEWLNEQPRFDLALCLHEDWEAGGFYCYELNPDHQPSLAEAIVRRVAGVCPIEHAPIIDGREAHSPGIIRPNLDPGSRPQWPEAFYLITHKTRLSYTLEAPSDFPLHTRVAALVEAVCAAVA